MKHLIAFVVMLILVFGISETYAQKATEIFIPVGQSPGVSGIYSMVAKIVDVKSEDQTINMSNSSGNYTVKIMEQTQIWLDRSKLKMKNKVGSFSDLKSNLTIEVRYKDKERKGEVIWVKIQLDNAGG